MTTAADPGARAAEGSCFLTVHATVLCTGAGGFVHVPITEAADRSDLVVVAAPPASLRILAHDVKLEPGPLTARGSGQAATVNLSDDGGFLSAGDSGGVVVRAGAPHRWEEFLPLAPASLGHLRDLVARDWVSLPDRRIVPAAASAILPEFGVLLGGRRVSLRDADLLRGGTADRLVLQTEGSLAVLQHVRPVLVFRHDGTAEADAEIALGLASLRDAGGFPGRVIAEVQGEPGEVEGAHAVMRRATAPGLLHFDPGIGHEEGPVLFVANGVLFDGPAAPIVAALAGPSRIWAAPWLRGAWELPPALAGDAVDPAIVAGGGGWDALDDLVAAARRLVPAGATHGDEADAAALQLALAADGACGPNPLRGFVAAGGPEARALAPPGRGLLNLRAVPRGVRAEVMREYLDKAQARPPELRAADSRL